MATVEFFREIKGHLNPGGIFGINVISGLGNPFTQGILRTVTTVFPQLYVFVVPGGNYLFLAMDRVDAPGREQLPSIAREMDPNYDFEPSLERMASYLREVDIDLTQAPYLTDKFRAGEPPDPRRRPSVEF